MQQNKQLQNHKQANGVMHTNRMSTGCMHAIIDSLNTCTVLQAGYLRVCPLACSVVVSQKLVQSDFPQPLLTCTRDSQLSTHMILTLYTLHAYSVVKIIHWPSLFTAFMILILANNCMAGSIAIHSCFWHVAHILVTFISLIFLDPLHYS